MFPDENYLNKRLRPRTMEIAKWLLRVTEDDLFYFTHCCPVKRFSNLYN